MGLDGVDELVRQVLVLQLPVKGSAVKVPGPMMSPRRNVRLNRPDTVEVQAGAGDEEIVMGAADGPATLAGSDKTVSPGETPGVVRHGCVQLPLDSALAGPAVHELDISRGVAVRR